MSQQDLIGKTLGQYQITGKLGQGGMASVYKAYQPRLDREVAVKVLPAYFAHEPSFAERFHREARAIAKLDHPNIVPVYDSGDEDGITFIVMKYVDAGTLKERIKGLRPDLKFTSKAIAQIASALDYAHSEGIIHRDVKPANVLISKSDWVQLSDFGIAKIAAETQGLTGEGVGVGTPEYMAPEQATDATNADARVDVYALGVILYQMVTGKLPYTGDTPMGVVIKHMQAPLPLVREVSPDAPESVERIVLRAMAKNPDDRFQTPGDLSAALVAAVAGQAITVDLPSADDSMTESMLEGAAQAATEAPAVGEAQAATLEKPVAASDQVSGWRRWWRVIAALLGTLMPIISIGGIEFLLGGMLLIAVAVAHLRQRRWLRGGVFVAVGIYTASTFVGVAGGSFDADNFNAVPVFLSLAATVWAAVDAFRRKFI